VNRTLGVDALPETTRRQLIGRVVLMAGALGASLAAGRAAAATKLSHGDVGYQPKPQGKARCELCVNWQAPDACKLVAGPISPSGWCGLFVPRP